MEVPGCIFDVELCEQCLYFGYKPLIGRVICKYFLSLYRLCFHLLMVSFPVQKFLSLTRYHLFIFAFISFALGDTSKKNYWYDLCQRVFCLSLMFWFCNVDKC